LETDYLQVILLLLAAAVVLVPLFQAMGFGAIPGFLVTGIILGPHALGLIGDSTEIGHLAELGVVLLMFVIGIEINPSRLWKMRSHVLGLGSLQILLTGALLGLLIQAVLDLSWKLAMLTGLSLALSSTAFVLQLLKHKGLLASDHGRPAMAILLMQDLAVVPLLALLALPATPEPNLAEDVLIASLETLLILGLIVFVARYILTPILDFLVRLGAAEIFTALALLLVLGSASLMERIGLSMAMGAFIAGLLIADSTYRYQIIAEIQPFRSILLGLFFISMGMSLNLRLVGDQASSLAAAVAALLGIKILVLWPLARLFGLGNRTALALSLLLAESGEFALVLLALSESMGLLDTMLFQYLLAVVLLSMALTPLLERLACRIASNGARPGGLAGLDEGPGAPAGTRPVILAGFGRMGHRIGRILELLQLTYVAIDHDAATIARERGKGRSAYYGDAQRPEVLRAAGVADAPLVIVSIDDIDTAERVVSTLHSAFPDTPVFARGHDMEKCRELNALGAEFTVSETLESSAELARAALRHMGADDDAITSALQQFREEYYARIDVAPREP